MNLSEMWKDVAGMEKAREALDGEKPEPVEVDPITELRRWRLGAGVRFVGKSLQVRGRK